MINDNITLTDDQTKAFKEIKEWLIHSDKAFKTLYGFAGTGKTVLIDFITDYTKKIHMKTKLTAPTNKAVRVLTELVEHNEFSTIHSLLNIKAERNGDREIFKPAWKKDHDITLYDLVIVDECSMVSEELLDIITQQVSDTQTKVLFVGDSAQLQPVGENISKTFNFDSIGLDKIVRYGSVIAQQAKKVRSNTEFVSMNSLLSYPEIVCVENDEMKELFKNFRDNPDKIRMACWTNNEVKFWNRRLRNFDYGEPVIEPFIGGDIVIANEPCKTNDEIIVMNSEEGEVIGVSERDDRYELTIQLFGGGKAVVNVIKDEYKPTLSMNLKKLAKQKNWTEYWHYRDFFHDVRHCYALTTHKHQGSTYDNIILNSPDISKNSDIEERNQLIYVAMTRAKNKVMIYNGF